MKTCDYTRGAENALELSAKLRSFAETLAEWDGGTPEARQELAETAERVRDRIRYDVRDVTAAEARGAGRSRKDRAANIAEHVLDMARMSARGASWPPPETMAAEVATLADELREGIEAGELVEAWDGAKIMTHGLRACILEASAIAKDAPDRATKRRLRALHAMMCEVEARDWRPR